MDAAERIFRDECFVLRAASLYRDTYSSKTPAPGQATRLTAGQLRAARESVNAALRRGAIRLVDAREELAVIGAALSLFGPTEAGTVPVMIGDDPYRIREPRKRKKSRSKKRRRK